MVASGWHPVDQPAAAEHAAKLDQIRALLGQRKACVLAARSNPDYAVLQQHLTDLKTFRFTMEQLADERFPTEQESRLFAAYEDGAIACNRKFQEGVAQISPAADQLLSDNEAASEAIWGLLVRRQLSWGEAAQRAQQTWDATAAKLRTIPPVGRLGFRGNVGSSAPLLYISSFDFGGDMSLSKADGATFRAVLKKGLNGSYRLDCYCQLKDSDDVDIP